MGQNGELALNDLLLHTGWDHRKREGNPWDRGQDFRAWA
jgi:hypothetical protein